MHYSPLCPFSLCTLLLVQGTMLSTSILEKKLGTHKVVFSLIIVRVKLLQICCWQILNTTTKAHGPFWFFHLAKRDDAKGNLTCFLLFRTLCYQIYAEAFASLERLRASFMLCGNWEATLQLAGPGTELLSRITGIKIPPWSPWSRVVCLCNSAANPARWAGRVPMKGYTGRHFSFPKLDLFFKLR